MRRVSDSNDAPSPPGELDTSPKQYVRLQGTGLPGGEQQPSSIQKMDQLPEQSEPTSTRDHQAIALPSSSIPSSSVAIYTYPTDENEHRYVGLVNQAMTCYLNSLVQSLYMTPEFRNAMYRWEYVTSLGSSRSLTAVRKGESSIPCQLQKLFLFLQTTDMDAYETRDLTASFGWSASEAYDQHDVQELCRLMFDALEHKWKGTEHEKLIQDLYRGTMEDFVKCLNCGNENIRIDYFLDLPLAVKPFGMSTAYKSVEEALQAFVASELLEGSNQYNCEKCQTKQNANKGLRITKFPYLLTIQLKRFDFDYNTMHRIKLNDKMTFPDILDLNSFLYRKGETPESSPKSGNATSAPMQMEVDESGEPMEFGSPPQKTVRSSEDEISSNPYEYGANEYVRVGQPIDKKGVEELLQKGENVYELFSVMVHSGNASGGHYFAYIKNMEQDKWYVFNDTNVNFAPVSDIERSFGGHVSGWNLPNTNAYMLMYRKVDPSRNARFIRTHDLPPHIRVLQKKWKEQEQEEEEQRKLQESLLSVHVALNYPFPSFVKNQNNAFVDVIQNKYQIKEDFVEYITEISREQSISQVFNQAFEFFSERAKSYGVTLLKNNSRLIHMDGKRMSKSLVSRADMDKKLRTLFSTNGYEPSPLFVMNFLLDSRVGSSPFPVEPEFGRMIKIERVDIAKRAIAPEFVIHFMKDEPVVRIKQLIGNQFRDDIHAVFNSRLVLEVAQKSQFLLIDTKMNGQNFYEILSQHIGLVTPTLYYDGGIQLMCAPDALPITEADRKKPFDKSTMFEVLDRKHFSIPMKIRFPSQDEITRSVSVSGVYSGPTWLEMHGATQETERSPQMSQIRESSITDSPSKEMLTEFPALPTDIEEDVTGSGRVSTASMRSISMDDLDSGEMGMVSGSFCNNTPQMSPSVSEGDEFDRGSSDEAQNQLKTERTIEYMTEQHFHGMEPIPGHDFSSPPAKRLPFSNDDAMSEPQSAVSSGASTLVPSTSTAAAINDSTTEDKALNGKIIVVSSNETYKSLDVDSRMKVRDLKLWIADQLQVEKGQFVMFKHTSDDWSDNGYETNPKEDDNIHTAFQSCLVSIKLRPPLKEDEKMIQVVQFDMLENNRDNWRTLFEIPASQKTLIGDFLLQSLRMYKDIYAEDLLPQNVRLRDISLGQQSAGKPTLNPNHTMAKRGHQWTNNIYMQIVTDESMIGKPGEPVLVRRFRPSSVEVSQTHEVLVDSNSPNQALAFIESLSKYSQIPAENISIIDLNTYGWAKWPYYKSPLEMLDGKFTFVDNFPEKCPSPDKFLSKVGTKVIYYKDNREVAKILNEEERKQIKIRENGQSNAVHRRKERPLRIQMSSVSEA